jgi:hypothetical protein
MVSKFSFNFIFMYQFWPIYNYFSCEIVKKNMKTDVRADKMRCRWVHRADMVPPIWVVMLELP